LPVANSAIVEDEAEISALLRDFQFPIIFKPTSLAGGNYIKAHSEAEAIEGYRALRAVVESEQFRMHRSGVMLQQWIDSGMTDNWSCEVFYDQHGRCRDHLTVARVRTSLNRQGSPTSRLYCGVTRENPELLNTTRRILDAVGWKGLAHVEYIHDRRTNEFKLTEINPRLPGYAYLLSRTGHEYGYFYAADLAGDDFAPPERTGETWYFEALRVPGDISDGILNALRGNLAFGPLLASYARALLGSRAVVIEHFNARDLPMTFVLLTNGLFSFSSRMVKYLTRRISAFLGRQH
jgi:predicted ATP-grasp superfamily ATP-dependent carboligase